MLTIEQIHEAIDMLTDGLREAGHGAWANALSMDASCAIEVLANHEDSWYESEISWLKIKSELVEGN